MRLFLFVSGVNTITNEELAIKVKQGDKGAELQLWEQVQRFIKVKAVRCLPDDGSTNRIELDDLMQAGYIAMLSAVKDFNHESGYAFITYLAYHLKSAFAQELGIRTSRRDALHTAVSMDAPQGSGNDNFTLADTFAAPDSETVFEDMTDRITFKHAFDIVMEHVEKLDPPQSSAIKQLYLDGMTRRQIAEQTGTTQAYVRKIEYKALRNLRGYKSVWALRKELYVDRSTDFYLHVGVDAFQSGAPSPVERLTERRELLARQL